jgi:hypothetical protein
MALAPILVTVHQACMLPGVRRQRLGDRAGRVGAVE